jgi:DNA-binding transcriptional ArsR family regulator
MDQRESLNLVGDPQAVRLALSPLRRQLLDHLTEPASAATLGDILGMPRQRVRHHLKVLEQAGLIFETGERRRRGFVEKLYAVRPGAMMIDPMLLGSPPPDQDRRDEQDRHSAEHLVRTAARMVHEVGRMRGEAEREGRRLITFTIEADVGFAAPSEIELFAARLTRAVADLARDYPANGDRRRFRLTATGHPAVGTLSENAERSSLN